MALTVSKCKSVEAVNWLDLETILLDMDGTLLDLQFDNRFWGEVVPKKWGELNCLDLRTSQQRLAPIFAAQQGTLNWYCLDYWTEKLGIDISTIKQTVAGNVSWRPQSETFLAQLKASHLDVVLITNAHPITLKIKTEQVRLAKWFNRIFSSHEFGAPKETPTFWEKLIAEHPFIPERTLFIDDSENVLDSAREFGITHLITLRQPDSTLRKREKTRFPAIHHFEEIMQGLPAVD